MKHIAKILTLLVTIAALWIGLLQAAIIPRSHTWLLPIYFVVSLGCYGLLMVGVGLVQFPTCPEEAVLLQKDVVEAEDFLTQKGVVVIDFETIVPNFVFRNLDRNLIAMIWWKSS